MGAARRQVFARPQPVDWLRRNLPALAKVRLHQKANHVGMETAAAAAAAAGLAALVLAELVFAVLPARLFGGDSFVLCSRRAETCLAGFRRFRLGQDAIIDRAIGMPVGIWLGGEHGHGRDCSRSRQTNGMRALHLD